MQCRAASIFLLAFTVLISRNLRALERLEPGAGCYIGFSLEPGYTIYDLGRRLGITPAVYNRYFKFSTSDTDLVPLTEFLEEVRSFHAIAMVTLEPWNGLQSVGESDCLRVAELCESFERAGIGGIFIRFAHEMNGNWYPWSQKPVFYKEKFRLLARIIHARTTRTAMLWSPNNGLGYPFGKPMPIMPVEEFAALDTNKDGAVNQEDDCYEPYYPGDDAVDWVGLTLYSWGDPWLENKPAAPNTFVRSITGTLHGNIPNFYGRYCAGAVRRKPMAIPETAAFFDTEKTGSSEFEIKQAWWRQVFSSGANYDAIDLATYYSKIKCVSWFDVLKQEGATGDKAWVDWRVSADPEIRAAFVHHIRAPRSGGRPSHYLTAEEARCSLTPDCKSDYLLSVETTPQGPNLTLQSSLGWTYQLFTSTDLNSWTPSGVFILGTGAQIRITGLPYPAATFYRVQAIPFR
jgi:hypothetical protein